MKRKILVYSLLAAAVAGLVVFAGTETAQAAPVEMADGGMFDPEYYAENYPDVVQELGTDPEALYEHYLHFGVNEGRKPYADQITDQEQKDKVFLLWSSNQTKAIFNRHRAMEITHQYFHATEHDTGTHFYMTRRAAYAESLTSALFASDRSICRLSAENDIAKQTWFIDPMHNNVFLMAGDITVPMTYEEFLNDGATEVVSCSTETGKLQVILACNEEKSARLMQDKFLKKYNGEQVRVSYTADINSAEIEEIVWSVLAGGKETVMEKVKVRYDTSEPLGCRNLRWSAEQQIAAPVTVTATMVETGASATRVVPLGASVSVVPENMQCFTDAACTNPVNVPFVATGDIQIYCVRKQG